MVPFESSHVVREEGLYVLIVNFVFEMMVSGDMAGGCDGPLTVLFAGCILGPPSTTPVVVASRGAPEIRLDAEDIHVFRKVSILKGVEGYYGRRVNFEFDLMFTTASVSQRWLNTSTHYTLAPTAQVALVVT